MNSQESGICIDLQQDVMVDFLLVILLYCVNMILYVQKDKLSAHVSFSMQ